MRSLLTVLALGLAGVLLAPPQGASATAEKTLYTCQATAGKEGEKFVKSRIKYVDACLKKIANEIIGKNSANAANAAKTCVKMFRRLNDSRAIGKSVPEKFAAKIQQKCDPASAKTLHTIDDITGKGAPGVSERIETQVIDTWCRHFGGDGSIDTWQEWRDCIMASHTCQANQAIAAQYPRAPEWLDLVRADMLLVVPSDPTEVTDAVAELDAVNLAIDSDGDDVPDISCGGEGVACAPACCYLEDVLPPGPLTGETACMEYTGPPAQSAAFLSTCGPGGLPGPYSFPGGFWLASGIPGPCVAGPTAGFPCIPGLNLVIAPKDSSCP
jgi:hypothetical protein